MFTPRKPGSPLFLTNLCSLRTKILFTHSGMERGAPNSPNVTGYIYIPTGSKVLKIGPGSQVDKERQINFLKMFVL